ncbi:MAG: aspartate--ammonia ligase [Clostridia bacterium]|nr:aspartate--ammonia ligase [Clostridia bacterium]
MKTGVRLAEGYASPLTVRETQRAIKFIKDTFQKELSARLHLERISAPLFVTHESGINDDLNGVERKVSFDAGAFPGELEVVQSLAKWKRSALQQYGFSVGEGLYTDMNAIRRDDDVDNTHSLFVDQWDWERVISREERTTEFLQSVVRDIVQAVAAAKQKVQEAFPALRRTVVTDVFFITSQELEDRYPDLSPRQRECEIVREHKTVFVSQIGATLKSGVRHDGRAPDYDDWSLNGDLLFWNEVLAEPIEISSMGIRVDADALARQLKITGDEDRMRFPYHRGIAEGTLPLTIGGGIGQSRLCMFLLEKMHIGEVHVSVWPEEDRAVLKQHGVRLL